MRLLHALCPGSIMRATLGRLMINSLATSMVRMEHMNGNCDFHLTEHPNYVKFYVKVQYEAILLFLTAVDVFVLFLLVVTFCYFFW